MTLGEIAALTLDSVVDENLLSDLIKDRLYAEAVKLDAELLFEDFEPTLVDMESELLVYKEELTAIENNRLRLVDLNNRIVALHDMPYAHATLRSEIPNAALWVKKNILENNDHEQAEFFMSELEVKDAELKAEVDDIKAAEAIIAQKRADLKAKPVNQITLPELIEVVKSLI